MRLSFTSSSIIVLLFSVFMSSLLGYSYAQETYLTPVSFPLKNPSNHKAEVTYTHQKVRYGKTRTIYKSKAILEIKSNNDKEFIASWTSKSTQSGKLLIDENSPKASGALMGVPFEFAMMRDNGSPTKLLDKERFFEKLIKTPIFDQGEAKEVENQINVLKSMDDEWILHTFFKIPSFMSTCQGMSFLDSEKNNYPVEYPNPFGEGMILGNTSVELTSLDTANNIAKIEVLTEFDQESFNQVLKQLVDSHADVDVRQLMSRKDIANCEVDLSTGWVRKAKFSTIMNVYGENVEENYDIFVNWKK